MAAPPSDWCPLATDGSWKRRATTAPPPSGPAPCSWPRAAMSCHARHATSRGHGRRASSRATWSRRSSPRACCPAPQRSWWVTGHSATGPAPRSRQHGCGSWRTLRTSRSRSGVPDAWSVSGPPGWVDADTLVFADRLQPQPFLLRALGLVDARPGTPAPSDEEGPGGPAGLWATGAVSPRTRGHARCADDGARVGVAIAHALRVATG